MSRKDITDEQVVQACRETLGTITAAADLLEERTGQPYKVVIRAMERALSRGLIEYGSTIRRAWPTDKGDALTGPAALPGKFEPGDIVTRGGDDLQRVLDVDEEGFCMTVVCIRAPASGWCKVGEEEHNLCRRYSFPSDAIEGVRSREESPICLPRPPKS